MCTVAITICHRCEHRQRRCNGACACTINGKDVIANADARECPKGKYPADMKCDDPSPPPSPPVPVPREDWPLWARAVAKRASVPDVGVGDTIQRLVAKVGGERFKAWSRKRGFNCGCSDRQAHYNAIYPYTPNPQTPDTPS